jgi:hypothetical protein
MVQETSEVIRTDDTTFNYHFHLIPFTYRFEHRFIITYAGIKVKSDPVENPKPDHEADHKTSGECAR